MKSTQDLKMLLVMMLAASFLSSISIIPSAYADSATLNPIANAMTAKVDPDTNFGNLNVFRVANATAEGSFGDVNAYLMFDLSSIPADATIDSATLSLYTYSVTATETIEVHYVADNSWTETGLTWNNAPTYVAALTASQDVTTVDQTYSWTVTDDVKTAIDTAENKLSLALTSPTVTEDKQVVFESRQGTNMPTLDVTYSVPSVGGAGGLDIWMYAAIAVIVVAVVVVAVIFLRRK